MTTLLLLACVLPFGKPPAAAVPAAPPSAAAAAAQPVSFAPLEQRVAVLLAEVQEADARDRLEALQELMIAMRNKDPASQQVVYVYLDTVIAVEERAREQPLPDGAPIAPPVEEEAIPDAAAPAPLEAARLAMKEGRYLDAVAAAEKAEGADAKALRREAVDAWARSERERAGHLYLKAKELPAGDARTKALGEARDALAAINTRFPDNAYAAQIRENVARVEADLAEKK
ncbi:MAG: hypothetical protein ACOZNI_10175 [Myxococcota bacterium]